VRREGGEKGRGREIHFPAVFGFVRLIKPSSFPVTSETERERESQRNQREKVRAVQCRGRRERTRRNLQLLTLLGRTCLDISLPKTGPWLRKVS
jgi:hypothetical protein